MLPLMGIPTQTASGKCKTASTKASKVTTQKRQSIIAAGSLHLIPFKIVQYIVADMCNIMS